MTSPIPILIELSPPLSALCESHGADAFARRLAADVSALLEELGLPGDPAVELRAVEDSRAIQVRVHGRWQPFDPELMTRVWRATCPAPLRAVADRSTRSVRRFPDAWLTAWFTEAAAKGETDSVTALEFLHRLILHIIRQRASCLVSLETTKEYVATAAGGGAVSDEHVLSVQRTLQSLLDWGAAAGNKGLVLESVRFLRDQGRTVDDAVELAFARLRRKRIEIHLHPDYARVIAPSLAGVESIPVDATSLDPKLRDLAQLLDTGLFYESGVVLPQMVWVLSPAIDPGCVAVRLNDLLGAPTRGLEPGELLVNADVSFLLLRELGRRPALNPATGHSAAIVTGAERSELETAGLTTWNPVEYVILFVSAEIRRYADRLLDVEDAEHQLARLETAFPELVHLALDRFSVEDIARILRGLVAEHVSIRNLRAILERIIQLDPIRVDSSLIVFDGRFTVRPDWPAGVPPTWMDALEFARSGLKSYLSHQLTRGQSTLRVLVVAPALEARVANALPAQIDAAASQPLSEVEEKVLLDQIWTHHAGADGKRPSVLTSSPARFALRRIVRAELPDVSVIAYEQISPSLSVEPMSRLSLD